MKLHICCSDEVKEKLNKLIIKDGITVDIRADYALVERGYDLNKNQISIVFNKLDYLSAYQLIRDHVVKDNVIESRQGSRITGYHEDRYTLINVSDILYIEAYQTKVSCITNDNKYLLKNPLYFYEQALRHLSINRINKSQLVNLMKVKEIAPWFNSRLVLLLTNGNQLEVSKKYSKLLRQHLDL